MERSHRNTGIDILRIISMFFIVSLHIIGRGGILDTVPVGSTNFYVSNFLFVAGNLGVNCFALISGFVGINRTMSKRKRVNFWLQVVFYSFFITLLGKTILHKPIGWGQVIFSLFPITRQSYWYATAYFVLCFFIPYLNNAIDTIEEDEAKELTILLIAIGSCVPTFVFSSDILKSGGLSALWLGLLYIVGALIRKYDILSKYSTKRLVCILLLCITFSWGYRVGVIVFENTILVRLIMMFSFHIDSFNSNLSITMVLCAICLLVIFSRIRVKVGIESWVTRICPGIFGVYLIHDHPVVRNYIFNSAFAPISEMYPLCLILSVLASAAGILVGGVIMDVFRQSLFRILNTDGFLKRMIRL